MSKMKKVLLRALPVVLIGLLVISNVFGISLDESVLSQGQKSDTVTKIAGGVWQTVATILQILAIAAVVLAGVRYMFASANDKADIKKQLVILVIGAILVFGATTILQLIGNASNEVMKN